MRKFVSVMALFVISLLTFSMVSALSSTEVSWGTIKVNGDEVGDTEMLAVEEGQTLSIKVGLKAAADVKDLEVEAEISGYEYADYEDLEDSTPLFDVSANTTKYVDLSVKLPKDLEKNEYWLRLRVMTKNGAALTKDVKLAVEPTRHGVDIADVVLSPGMTVKAGRYVLASVLLENYGDKDEKDVKVTVAVPELGVSAVEYVDVMETDNHNVEREDVPEMFLSIPATAAEGDYQLKATATYDDLRETVTKTYTLHVVPNELFQKSDKLVLAVGPETQTVAAGKTAVYGIALANEGVSSKAYTLEVVTGDWATASLSDVLVVLEPGKTKTVTVDVTPAADAPAGEHTVSVAVKSGSETLETVALKASVVPGQANSNLSLRNGLEIALIVLVVLLVVIGLIIGFSRLRKDDEGEEQTYY
ncbi:hypothetical protein J4228_03655 [Candidatus Woesearchaeota archaeon]|nr:hypothetical protein [Candidatus Woesearchaeota archaeon]